MSVEKVISYKANGKLFSNEADAIREDACAALLRFCQRHFNGGEYRDDMIADVLQENASEVHALLDTLLRADLQQQISHS